MSQVTWGPLMPFFNKSNDFTEGFECGQLWERIKNGESFAGQPIHKINIPQIERICSMYGVIPYIEVYDEEWACLSINSTSIN